MRNDIPLCREAGAGAPPPHRSHWTDAGPTLMKMFALPPPVTEILTEYWKADRRLLLLIAAIVVLSSLATVAAPYQFSRLIDRISTEGIRQLAGGFLI